jgi:hypothetical protein
MVFTLASDSITRNLSVFYCLYEGLYAIKVRPSFLSLVLVLTVLRTVHYWLTFLTPQEIVNQGVRTILKREALTLEVVNVHFL